jgi:hypothetical protein
LPPELGVIFTVARATAVGVGEGRLRGRDLARSTRGVRTQGSPETLRDHLRALALVLPPSAVFSHTTAARMLRLPLPRGVRAVVHVTTPPGSPRVVRRGVVGHRGNPDTHLVQGVQVSDPLSTWADLAAALSLDDLVVMGDGILRRRFCTLEELRVDLVRRAGARGIRHLREASELVRADAKSVMETRARLVMHRAGLPEPVLNQDIYDDNGDWLGCPDFAWPERKVLVEYDGDHHRTDRVQWQRDVARRRLMQEAGWRVIVITADDVLRHPFALVELIRSVLG